MSLSGEYMVCEKCGKRMDREFTYESRYPELNEKAAAAIDRMHAERGSEPPPALRYHAVRTYEPPPGKKWHNPDYYQTRSCGPVHAETEQEHFVHWIGSSMDTGKKKR